MSILYAILFDIPAAIVTIWWNLYTILLTLITMLTVTVLLTMLALASVGIRWGW